jgi:AcrR family transcriptional regulator
MPPSCGYLWTPNAHFEPETPSMSPAPDARERILDAAKAAFHDRGTSGARMQEIADSAGINKALIHYYFKNKDTLAAAVFQRELRTLVQPVMQTLASDLPLDDKVRTVIGMYLDRLPALPQMPGYILAEMHFHPERLSELMTSITESDPQDLARRVFDRLGAQIDAAVAAGRMAPIPPHQFMVNLVALCVFPFAARPLLSFVMGGSEVFDTMIEERRESLTQFFLRGLRP